MRYVVLLIIVLSTGCAHQDEWTKQDTTRQWAVTGLLAADAYTTTQIQHTSAPNERWERGFIAQPVLGWKPATEDTVLYFSTVAISHYVISRALPTKWRVYWQEGAMLTEAYTVIDNCKWGLC